MILLTTLIASLSMATMDGLPLSREQQIDRLDKKMRTWRGDLKEQGSSGVECVMRRSTGDGRLDAIACNTLIQCTGNLGYYLKQAKDAPSEAERQKLLTAVRFDLEQCTRNARRKEIERLVDR